MHVKRPLGRNMAVDVDLNRMSAGAFEAHHAIERAYEVADDIRAVVRRGKPEVSVIKGAQIVGQRPVQEILLEHDVRLPGFDH